jgi:hypothetical protein
MLRHFTSINHANAKRVDSSPTEAITSCSSLVWMAQQIRTHTAAGPLNRRRHSFFQTTAQSPFNFIRPQPLASYLKNASQMPPHNLSTASQTTNKLGHLQQTYHLTRIREQPAIDTPLYSSPYMQHNPMNFKQSLTQYLNALSAQQSKLQQEAG